ncbi:MAG TPA: CYTH domain-containing protein [Candidatus Nanoarchaeia archaeon]|nr:CYTH domain-containing protein [Candidatus Nanoarchaeia archaeon]
MNNIEVELKVFISEQKYNELLDFFTKNAEFLKKDNQETYYFDCKEDFRIQKNDYFSKLVWKSGKVHDHQREEIEIKFDKDDFSKSERLLKLLGFDVGIKWFRERTDFKWNDISISVDFTKGYGYILELEKMSSEQDKEKTEEYLKEILKSLNLELTPREEFEKKFKYYKENWRILI